MMARILPLLLIASLSGALIGVGFSQGQSTSDVGTAVTQSATDDPVAIPHAVGHPSFVSPHASPIAVTGGHVFVANTPADTIDVINTQSRKIGARINVGIDPVSVAVRPDGNEVWVSNHISDSVSVIDTKLGSPTYLNVVATVQEFDPQTKATRFDEPVGIAFAGNEKAYVALSSENQIAVIDVASRRVTKRLDIPAQDPRAIFVRGDHLYVVPFESNNKTQLSGGDGDKIDGELVTFDAWEHSIRHNNVLSLGHVVDIVKHPDVPDRDLFVFDTETDELVETVDTLGTLLYGLTVDSQGRAFIAQTDARNEVNRRTGTKQHGLKELENRAFLNRITRVDAHHGSSEPTFIDLEPLPPEHPQEGEALATPFGIQISNDDSTLFVTAAGSNKLAAVDVSQRNVFGRVDVGAVPRGIALQHSDDGHATQAWILNAAANTVSLVDVSEPTEMSVSDTIMLEDPTHPLVKRGRIAFETAAASTTGTYSCASCHPDGHTDQLLWVLKTPIVSGGDQIMPRSTMPIRGLRDTEPYHWDGVPGDPYGGNNSANVHGTDDPNCSADDPCSATRHLIDGGLAATMAMVDNEGVNDEGKAGRLTAAERDDMATFLLSVPYPPAQKRAYTNVLSDDAKQGFKLFHIDGDNDPSKPKANICGDCHRMPFWVSTNTPGTGMDAPTWRGAYDRFLILPQGRLNIIDFDFYARVADRGIPERDLWRFSWGGRERFDAVWDMVLEGSTGFPGAAGRQVTLNRESLDDDLTTDLLDALEQADIEGGVVLQAEGVFINHDMAQPVVLQFEDGHYLQDNDSRDEFSRSELISLASTGRFTGTFTGRFRAKVDVDHPQPALWTLGPIHEQRGTQDFPILTKDERTMTLSGRHIDESADVLVDGRRVAGNVQDEDGAVEIELEELPPVGMHFVQVQNPNGLQSNDFIFHVSMNAPAAEEPPPKTLAEALSRHGWEKIIGTWVDEGTGGKFLKATYAWKIEDRVIEVTSHKPNNQSITLIALNAKSHEIFEVGGDSTGATFLGSWTEDDGDAVYNFGYTGPDGTEGTLAIRYKLVDDDTLIVTLQLPQLIAIRMKRAD